MKKHPLNDIITVEVALTLVSDKARAVYDWVVDYHAKNGISPVLRDVSVGLGMSLTNVNHHVNMLKKSGLMRRSGYRVNRAIVVAGGKFSVDRTALIFPWFSGHLMVMDFTMEVSNDQGETSAIRPRV